MPADAFSVELRRLAVVGDAELVEASASVEAAWMEEERVLGVEPNGISGRTIDK